MAHDPQTGQWCHNTAWDGALCPPHAQEFRYHAAAEAATRVVKGQAVADDPAAALWRRWMARTRVRRARTLRRQLLGSDRLDGTALNRLDHEWERVMRGEERRRG